MQDQEELSNTDSSAHLRERCDSSELTRSGLEPAHCAAHVHAARALAHESNFLHLLPLPRRRSCLRDPVEDQPIAVGVTR